MRINQFIARSTGLSRRSADDAVAQGRVTLNAAPAKLGSFVTPEDVVTIDGKIISAEVKSRTVLLNKPVGYVCSRDGQGSKTVYDLLPPELHQLKPVGRLDKDSSGLLLLTNDGQLAQKLTHPSFQKQKVYEIELDKNLAASDREAIEAGVKLEDGISKLALAGADKKWVVSMSEGRNRQIRRTFASLGYTVTNLHRTQFGEYDLGFLEVGKTKVL